MIRALRITAAAAAAVALAGAAAAAVAVIQTAAAILELGTFMLHVLGGAS